MAHVSAEDIRRLARLARLEVASGDVERLRTEMGAVLGWMDRLGELDLTDTEPMTRPGDVGSGAGGDGSIRNRLADDEPGSVLANDVSVGLASEAMPPFFRVPKVLGDGGGA